MSSLASYFTPLAIVSLVCKYRIKYAKQRHKLHLIRNISKHPKTLRDFKLKHALPEDLSTILPPRRQWLRIDQDERAQFSNSNDINLASLKRTITTIHLRVKLGEIEPPEWYIKLQEYIHYVQRCISIDSPYSISEPTIFPEIKDKGTKTECRPLAVYKFTDRIIISLTAKYLTDTFDPFLVDDVAYAFRSTKYGKFKSHHDTILEIEKYKIEHIDEDLWAAECDIRKFFDCVNQNVAINCYNEFVNSVTGAGKRFDTRATEIFLQYLRSYSFNSNVLPLNSNTTYFKNANIPNGVFSWVSEAELKRMYGQGELERIGIPQGGAISCLLANLILHKADLAVAEIKGLRYLRFCDDMVVIGPNKDICLQALEVYQNEMQKLKLLVHEPKEFTTYSAHFWHKSVKSKLPYKWAKKIFGSANVPWLSFVGYQIRYDGSIRIRAKSIRTEILKQKRETRVVMNAIKVKDKPRLNLNSRKSKSQQLISLEKRLISMSIGRATLKNYQVYNPSYCWLIGFKVMNANSIISKQLKQLDKSRGKQLRDLKKSLKGLSLDVHKPQSSKESKYRGAPFSYHFSIIRKPAT